VYFWAGGVTLAAGDNLDLIGGAGGAGGSGIANGSNGIQGTISAAVTQNLLNQGNLILDATNAILQVGGAYTQTSGASLQLVLGGSGAVSSGFVTVGGTAQLGGGLDLTAASGLTAPAIGQSVTLMAAGSLTGQFDNVNESLTGMRLLPLYFSQALLLESINPSFQSSGVTPNQKAIGVDLDAVALKPQLNGLMASIGVLSNSSMQAIFGQLTPEDFTALYQAGFEGALSRAALVDQRLSELMNDVDNTPWLPGFSSTGTPWFAANLPASQEAAMAPSKSSPWGGFISGNGGIFNVASDANAAGYKVTTYGLTGAGADYRLSRELAVGLLVGYGHTNVVLGTGGTLSADGGQIGLYGLLYSEGFYATGLVEGGINSYGTQRQGYNGVATGSTQGSQFDGALELGYQWKAAQVKIGPMASAQYSSVGMNGFTEQGSQGALTFPTQTENSLLSRLGIRANSQWSLGKGSALSPSLQLAWEHEFNYQGGNIQAGFGTGDSFTVAGPQIGQDGLLAGAGVEISWAKSWTLSLQYQGEFGRTNLTSSQIGGGVKFGF
jgi:outer membrane autotransporter protein